jgi:hypothetical protein
MKKSLARFFYLSAIVFFVYFMACGARAAPVFSYQFASSGPTSWNGVGGSGTTVTDLSSAHHDGVTTGGPLLSPNVPFPAPADAESMFTDGGGMRTNATSLLSNALIAASGGFQMDAWFEWDGSDNAQHTGKIIDYAGTDYLQIQFLDIAPIVRFGFNDDSTIGTNLIAPIVPFTWYHVTGVFDTTGNTIAGDGSLTGEATLFLDGVAVGSDTVTKLATNSGLGTAGDALNRRIGVGYFSASAGSLIQFRGWLYNPSVDLIPEPATAILICIGAAFLAMARTLGKRQPSQICKV